MWIFKYLKPFFLVCLLVLGTSFIYPVINPSQQVDLYHGKEVKDPYRSLEVTNLPSTKAWIEDQNALTLAHLKSIPKHDEILKLITSNFQFERFGSFQSVKDKLFFFKNSSADNQPSLYVLDTKTGNQTLILDPNTLSSEGLIAVTFWKVSPDGKWLAYALSKAGSDWSEIRIRNTTSLQDLSEKIEWVKSSEIAWTKDSLGFYYSCYPKPEKKEIYEEANFHQKICYHSLYCDPSQDRLIYEEPQHKDRCFMAEVSKDGQFLIISISEGASLDNQILYMRLDEPHSLEPLFRDQPGYYIFIGSEENHLFFLTTYQALKGKVITVDTPSQKMSDIVPESEESIQEVAITKNHLIVSYLHDAYAKLSIYTKEGHFVEDTPLPSLGSVPSISSNEDETFFYSVCSFTYPYTLFKYDIASHTSKELFPRKIPFSPEEYETIQVFYKSKDGTQIPLFLSYKKGLDIKGNHPTYLYGYGGFNVSLSPWFSPTFLTFMQMGGVVAVANLRGGGEYGQWWHEAGMLENKQNVFDDFIAASEYLTREHISSPQKLAIGGGSNGGLLVGACLTQRPELFAAAIAQVGVFDMLRFHLFTVGWMWVPEYGSSENPKQFDFLYKYSPLHQAKPQFYPPTLLLTADHDDRVVPFHSYKFAATLQACQLAEYPILIRIESLAGHGGGKPLSKIIEENSALLTFLYFHLGM